MTLLDTNEEEALASVLCSYRNYGNYALREYYEPRLIKWNALHPFQRELVPGYNDYLNNLHDAILHNSKFLRSVADFAQEMIGITVDEPKNHSRFTMDKVVSMLSQLYREWSEEARKERSLLLKRIMPVLHTISKTKTKNNELLSVLVPGVGTGRLIADLVHEGYQCEGNEYSFHMLVMSMYMLNSGQSTGSLSIYPFIHTNSHWKERKTMLKEIKIPDFNVHMELNGNNLMQISMGSFVDCFGPNENIWGSSHFHITQEMNLTRLKTASSKDVVLTNFFIDTSSNILEYLLAIQHTLKPGGIWINFGPLVYHQENEEDTDICYEIDPFSGEKTEHKRMPLKGIELTFDEIIEAAYKLDFELLHREDDIISGYGEPPNQNGMPGYRCSFWVMKLNTQRN